MRKMMIPVIGVLIALAVAVTGALAFMGGDESGNDRSGKSFLDLLITAGTGPDVLIGATATSGSDNPGGTDAVSGATPGGGTPGGSGVGWQDDDEDSDSDEDDKDDDEEDDD